MRVFVSTFLHVGPTDIQQHNVKLVLGLIRTLVLHYHISKRGKKERVLEWIRVVLPSRNIKNFTTHWNDGVNLCGLVDYCQPGLIPDWASLDPSNAVQNVTNAINLADKHLGIPQVIQPEDLAVDKPDELSVMTYLSYFCCSGSPGQKVLLAWLQEHVHIPNHRIHNFTTDWTDGHALGLLINNISKGEFPECNEMTSETATANCKKCLDAAEELLGVKHVTEPEEFASPDLDELVRMAYLAGFQHTRLPPRVTEIHIPKEAGKGEVVWLDLECPDNPHGAVEATAKGSQQGRLAVEIVPLTHTKRRIKFLAKQTDTYTLLVFYGEHRIKGSPFTFNLTPPDAFAVEHTSTITTKRIGAPVSLSFDTTQAGRGKITAEVSGAAVGSVPVQVELIAMNSYRVSFRPQKSDTYYVKMNLDDQVVVGSPFVLPLLSLVDPSKVVCGDPNFTKPGEPLTIAVDVSEAGKGILTADCSGPKGGEVEVTIVDTDGVPGAITFIPPVEDLYTLSVFYEDGEVKGSPFQIDIRALPPNPDAVIISNPPSGVLNVGEEITIGLNTSKAGVGEITATCQSVSKKTGDVPVTIIQQSTAKFILRLTPPEQDIYSIDILWSGTSIRGSPFSINMIPKDLPDPSRCKLMGTEDLPELLLANEEICLQVHVANAGKGMLHATVDEPQQDEPPPKLEVQPSRDDPHLYNVRYTPISAGTHRLHLKWGGKPIPDSPVNLDVIAPKTFAFGKPVDLEVRADLKRKNTKVFALKIGEEKSKSTTIRVRIDKISTGHFIMVFHPKQPGLYRVHVLDKGSEIPDSPFIVNYTEQAKPEACIVDGLFDSGYVGEPMKFTVDAKEAGIGAVSLRRGSAQSNGSGRSSASSEIDDGNIRLIDNRDGTYSAIYTPDSPGCHNLNLRFAGIPIPGSPFRISVQNREKEEDGVITGLNLENEKFRVGVPYMLKLHCEELGDGAPEISCSPPEAAKTKLARAPGPNSYWCEILPVKVGHNTISVQYNGGHLFGSPFHVTFAPRGDATKCKMMDIAMECQQQVGDNVVFCISTKGAGKGKVTASAKSLTTKMHVPVKITHPHKHHYNLEFNPDEGFEYMLTVKYDEQHIEGSPFRISLGEPSRCIAEGEGLTSAMAEKVSKFTVKTTGAGPGELQVIINGITGKIKPTISEIEEREYEVAYRPTAGGRCSISVLWGGVDIPGSPFEVTCVDPAQFTITDDVSEFCFGQPLQFTISSDFEVQEEKLAISLHSSSSMVPGKVENVDDLLYIGTVSPPSIGPYAVHVCWNEVHVKGSPLNINVIPTPVPQDFTFEAAELAANTLGVRVCGPKQAFRFGELSAAVIHIATKEQLPVKVTQVSQEWCDVEFNPDLGSGNEYQLSIRYDGEHITGSPFRLLSTDAAQCYTKGKGLTAARVGDWNTFVVCTENSGPGELKVDIEEDGEALEPFISAADETQYEVSYLPNKIGTIKISIKWDDRHIPGSPFKIKCADPTKFSIAKPFKEASVGEPVQFTVLVESSESIAKWEEPVVVARAKHRKDIPGTVKKTRDGNYSCKINIKETGKYVIHARCNNFEIEGSPLKVRMMPAPVPKNVMAYGPGLEDGIVGQQGQFTINIAEAGYGHISFKVLGPKDAFKINMHHHPNVEGAIQAQYNPSHSGVFTISILWVGVHVPGSPFTVMIKDE